MQNKLRFVGIALIVLSALGASSMLAAQPDSTAGALFFAENRGQYPDEVRFALEAGAGAVWLLDDEIWLTVVEPAEPEAAPFAAAPSAGRTLNLRITFPGAATPALVPSGRVDTNRTYLLPQAEFTEVPLWQSVRLENLFPGIALEARTAGSGFSLNLVPDGGEPGPAAMHVEGAAGLRVEGGRLIASTAIGDVVLPVASELDGLAITVGTEGGGIISFAPPRPEELTRTGLEPAAGTVIYASYYGIGGKLEYGAEVASDAAGNAYYAGAAPAPLFINQPGLRDPQHLVNAWIIKLNPAGTGADYLVTISGSGIDTEDMATSITVDGSGQAYVAGYTSSDDFPATPGAFDVTFNGGLYDGWLAKIDPAGGIDFATLLGSGGTDVANAVKVGLFGQVYVTGFTNGPGFPKTSGAYDPVHNGGTDAFLAKFSSDGSALLAGTFLGGSGDEGADLGFDRSDLLVDVVGNAIITGPTLSSNFPTTGPRIGPGGCKDIYVAKFKPDLSGIYFSTRIGGSGSNCDPYTGNGNDNPEQLAQDASGAILISGYTSSAAGSGFPTSVGAFDVSANGSFDAFLLKLGASGANLLYGTYLGGTSVDVAKDLAVDGLGRAYLTGYTFSAGYPASADAYDSTLTGGVDAFVTKLQPGGAGGADLIYSTFLGGAGIDQGVGLALTGQDILHLTGLTASADFPITAGSYQTIFSGDQDAYLMLFHLPGPVPPSPTPDWTPAPYNLNLPITDRH